MRFFLLLPASLLFACVLRAAPVDLSPPATTLGVSNSEGYILLSREIDEADFGNGLTFPVRLIFKSQPGQSSPYLGAGWQLAMLECGSGLYREGMMKAVIPCGKRLWLYSKKRGSNDFETLDQEWKGKLEKKTFTISRPDGWQIKYLDGKLASIRTSEGRILQWTYEGKNAVTVSEGGNRAVQVLENSEGKMDGLNVNGRRHKIELGQRPRVAEVSGRRLVEALDPALAKWTFPDGSFEEFEFSLDEERQPLLSTKSREGLNHEYSWDAKTGFIRSEDGWTYDVSKGKAQFDPPRVARTNAGGAKEEFFEDDKTGIVTVVDAGGAKTVLYKFKTLGPLFGKLQKVERVEKDGGVRTMMKLAYDEKGQILSRTDERGFITSFIYDENGRVKETSVKLSKDPQLLAELRVREQALLKRVSEAKEEGAQGDALQALGFFTSRTRESPRRLWHCCPE